MKKTRMIFPAVLMLLVTLGASVLYFHNQQLIRGNGQAAQQTKPTVIQSDTDGERGNSSTAEGGTPASQAYVLPILGKSGHLTKVQISSMDKWRKSVLEMALQQPEEIFLNGKGDQKAVGLTFDDGPDGVVTPKVLDLLRSQGIHATFFFVGKQMESYPQVVKETASQGNLVLSHTYAHKQLDHLSGPAVEREITLNDQLLQKLTGQQPVGVRPPYGAINANVITQFEKQGKLIILWSIDTLDWTGETPQNVAANVLDNVRPGDIILMHSINGRNNTLAALPLIIDGLRQKGYSMERLDQLLGRQL